MPKTFDVKQYETHISTWQVTAESEEDAIRKVQEGDAEMICTEYVEVNDEKGDNGIQGVETATTVYI